MVSNDVTGIGSDETHTEQKFTFKVTYSTLQLQSNRLIDSVNCSKVLHCSSGKKGFATNIYIIFLNTATPKI